MKLVKFQANWADELDVNGFTFYSDKEWENIVATVKKHKFPETMYVGTNEDIELRNAKQVLGFYVAEDITDVEKNVIEKFFDWSERGKFEAPWENWDEEYNPEDDETEDKQDTVLDENNLLETEDGLLSTTVLEKEED